MSLADAGDIKETNKEVEDVIGVKSKIPRIAIRTSLFHPQIIAKQDHLKILCSSWNSLFHPQIMKIS